MASIDWGNDIKSSWNKDEYWGIFKVMSIGGNGMNCVFFLYLCVKVRF